MGKGRRRAVHVSAPSEVREALLALGYRNEEIRPVLDGLPTEGAVEVLLREGVFQGRVQQAGVTGSLLGIVPLVCERATSEDLDALDEICARSQLALRNGDYSMDLSAEFHARVAQATRNPAVSMLVESFRGPILMSLEQAKATAPEMGELGTQEHLLFIEAVRARDPEAAAAIMRR